MNPCSVRRACLLPPPIHPGLVIILFISDDVTSVLLAPTIFFGTTSLTPMSTRCATSSVAPNALMCDGSILLFDNNFGPERLDIDNRRELERFFVGWNIESFIAFNMSGQPTISAIDLSVVNYPNRSVGIPNFQLYTIPSANVINPDQTNSGAMPVEFDFLNNEDFAQDDTTVRNVTLRLRSPITTAFVLLRWTFTDLYNVSMLGISEIRMCGNDWSDNLYVVPVVITAIVALITAAALVFVLVLIAIIKHLRSASAVSPAEESEEDEQPAVQEKEATGQECKTIVQEKEATGQEWETTVQEKEATGQEWGTIVQEKDATGQEKETTGQEWETTGQEKETTGREWGTTAQATGQEWETTVQEKKATEQEYETMQEKKATGQERETTGQECETTSAQEKESTGQDWETTAQEWETTAQEWEIIENEQESTTAEALPEQESTESTQEEGG